MKRYHIASRQCSTSNIRSAEMSQKIRSDEEVEPEMTGCESEVGLSVSVSC